MIATLDEQLASGIAALKLAIPSAQQKQLLDYVGLLDKWNRIYNLTAVREPERMVSHHLLDCLAILPWIDARRVLDVGSGGGMPGIPLAITHPEWSITLLDSNHKKTTFLRQAAIDLALANVEVITDRVESVNVAEKFDLITSRAFSDLGEFINLTRHLLAEGGCYAALKGVHPYEEIALLPKDFAVEKVIPLVVPGLDAERHLVIIRRAA